MVKYDEKVIKELGIDIRNNLRTMLKKEELQKILNIAIKNSFSAKDIADLLTDENYFSFDDIFKALEQYKKDIIYKLFDEPKDEKEMAKPVIRELNEQGYTVAVEVPLPKKGKAKPRKIDVAGYKKEGFRKKISIYGFELKCKGGRDSIDKAFAQANDYKDYCEQVSVCFSPLMYLKYHDVIKDKIKKYKGIGVKIVSKSNILIPLGEAYSRDISDKTQREMVEYIDGKRKK